VNSNIGHSISCHADGLGPEILMAACDASVQSGVHGGDVAASMACSNYTWSLIRRMP